MMRSLISLIALTIAMSIISCCKTDHCASGGRDLRLKVNNNLDSSIYIYYSAAYPDTNSYLTFTNYQLSQSSGGKFNSKSQEILSVGCSWDSYYEKFVKSDTLMIFFIKDEGQGEDHLKDHHTVLKRYDLTLQNLEKKNWIITYP
jgi:hypothetical protein